MTSTTAKPGRVTNVVKVVDTRANEWVFMEAHHSLLSELHLLPPRAKVQDFVPGVSALILPKLTVLRDVDPSIVAIVLPQLISVGVSCGCVSVIVMRLHYLQSACSHSIQCR